MLPIAAIIFSGSTRPDFDVVYLIHDPVGEVTIQWNRGQTLRDAILSWAQKQTQESNPNVDSSPDADYATVVEAAMPGTYNAVLMQWNRNFREHTAARVSARMSEKAARALAQSWAATSHLEVR